MVSKIGHDWYNGQKVDCYMAAGTACRDAETRMFSDGEKCVCKVSVACGQRRNTETIFLTVNCWNSKAKLLAPCRKGDTILAIGKISTHEYNGKEYTNLDADFLQIAGRGAAAGDLDAVAQRAEPVNPDYSPDVSGSDFEEIDDVDGELPF